MLDKAAPMIFDVSGGSNVSSNEQDHLFSSISLVNGMSFQTLMSNSVEHLVKFLVLRTC